MEQLKLEVGKRYLDQDNKIVTIESSYLYENNPDCVIFEGSDLKQYLEDGVVWYGKNVTTFTSHEYLACEIDKKGNPIIHKPGLFKKIGNLFKR